MGIGDTTFKVLKACGAPDYREIRLAEKVRKHKSDTYRNKTITIKAGQKYKGMTSGDETWYYDLGPSQFVYQIEFSKSKVNAIRKQGAGSAAGVTDWSERKRLAK